MMRAFLSAACTLGILAGCSQSSQFDQAGTAVSAIYGGTAVDSADPIAKSTVALLSSSDYQTDHAIVDGSGTLVAPNIIVGAAHTCLNFQPSYASFGPNPPDEQYGYSYGDHLGTSRYPLMRRITNCVAHPQYKRPAAEDEQTEPVNDIAVFFIDSTPPGFTPARVHAPTGTVPSLVTIAGFGAFDNQFDDIHTSGMLAYGLRKVDSFVSAVYPVSRQFMDGPNAGHGSCQGDSGGSVYARIVPGQTPVLLGMPVSGPECDLGIGYNTDIRYFVAWIESTAGVTLTRATVNNSCGNGTREPGETCDGTSVRCATLGSQYTGGVAPCNSMCSGYDATACVVAQPTCGNGTVETGEACDGSSLACTSIDPLRFSGGQAVCRGDCSGYDTTNCTAEIPSDSCTASPCAAGPNLAIPDNNATGISSTIRVDNYSSTLDRVRVTTRMQHSYRGDLVVTLTSPEGTTKTLHDRSGGSADDLMLDLTLADFAGQHAVGDWTLTVADRARSDVGKLESWTLALIAAQTAQCGNAHVEAGETCDGHGIECTTLDSTLYLSGTAQCKADCSGFETHGCVLAPACGNGVLESGETCDSNTVTCTALDPVRYESGQAACNATCSAFTTDGCVVKPSTDACVASPCSNTQSQSIPDNSATGISSPIAVASFSGVLSKVRVTTDIRHTYRGDLLVTLVSPTGTSLTLHNRTGSSADDLVLDVETTAFAGQDSVGTWTLKVSDRASADVGTLRGWTLQLVE